MTTILAKANKGTPVFKKYERLDEEQVLEEESDSYDDYLAPMEAPAEPTLLYFYHPDHLGTSTFLTDGNGQLYQFYLNLPFGETMTEQHSLTEDYETPFKFNGKELDNETGYYYYGARFYDPKTSIWLSVDPLAEKFPNYNPYAYCFQNPVRYTDPDGRIPIIPWLLKAGAGAAADMLAQASMDYLFNPSTTSWGQAFDNVNWYQVGRSGLEALIPWKSPGGRVGKAALTASGDVLVNAMNDPSGYTAEQAGLDFATGFIGDLAGGGFGDLIAKYGAKNIASGLVGKLGWAAKKAHALTGVWHSTSDGNYVGSLATRLGKVVDDIDVGFEFSGGSGDVDIMTSNFNVEVKSGGKMKLTQSIKNLEYAKSQGKGYILYMPNATSAQMKEARKQGITIYNKETDLKKALNN